METVHPVVTALLLSEMDMGPKCWTQPDPTHFLNDSTQPKQAEHVHM